MLALSTDSHQTLLFVHFILTPESYFAGSSCALIPLSDNIRAYDVGLLGTRDTV